MKVGFDPLTLVVHPVDFIAAAIDLDAAHLPFLGDKLLFELGLRLPSFLWPGIAGRESRRLRYRCWKHGSNERNGRKSSVQPMFHEIPFVCEMRSQAHQPAADS